MADINPKVQGIYTLRQGSYQLLSRCFTFQTDGYWLMSKIQRQRCGFSGRLFKSGPAITLWAPVSINPPLVLFFFFFHIYLKPRKKALHQAAAGFWIMWIKLGATRGLTTSYCSLKLLVCACACVCIHVHTRIGEEAVKSHQWGQVIKSCHSANFSKNRLAGYSKPEGHLKKLKL